MIVKVEAIHIGNGVSEDDVERFVDILNEELEARSVHARAVKAPTDYWKFDTRDYPGFDAAWTAAIDRLWGDA